mmetsp:Transcript_84880/g.226480  ORF Transcript_84880/g.226480 Transcript_84880/m.226480 type:complete len:206 (-) Transcript_84880:90-707(-)
MMTCVRMKKRSRPACMPARPVPARYRSRARCILSQPSTSASRNCRASMLLAVALTCRLMSFSNSLSMSRSACPNRKRRPQLPTSSSASGSMAARALRMNWYSAASLSTAALATSDSKLASSLVSPAAARANRSASAEYSITASRIVRKLPADLDILAPSSMMCPLVRKPLGHMSRGSMAAWVKRQKSRWLGMRSRPDTRRSMGYQ